MLHLPPIVGLFLTICLVIYLFRRDARQGNAVTGALWLPLIWVLLMGSRSVSQWLNVLGLSSLGSVEEGNPLDAIIYFSLIAGGIHVLNQRRVSFGEVIRENKWLMVFLCYCFIAILWSDYQYIAFKRWIKVLGHPIMALVIFTEPDPQKALTTLMKRSAYILVPFSICAIKYYPEIGRGFDKWTGIAMNLGIAQTKNMLGCDCFVLGFYFSWYFLKTWRSPRTNARRQELYLVLFILAMTAWLLYKSHSATSSLSLIIGGTIVLLLERSWVNKRFVGTYAIAGIVLLGIAELCFGIVEQVVDLTGHNDTIMGRTALWGELLDLHTNPLFGVGFESFWLGDRLTGLWETHWWHPNEAHNGYLDLYLDLGLVGVFFLVATVVSAFRKARAELLRNFVWGQYRMGFLIAVVFYNCTEATFRGLSLIWFIFYIIAMDYSDIRSTATEQFAEIEWEEEPEMVKAQAHLHGPLAS